MSRAARKGMSNRERSGDDLALPRLEAAHSSGVGTRATPSVEKVPMLQRDRWNIGIFHHDGPYAAVGLGGQLLHGGFATNAVLYTIALSSHGNNLARGDCVIPAKP